MDVERTEVGLDTPDGTGRAFLFVPAGGSSWPAAIMFMDVMGIRPALFGMAERLAAHGHAVLLPDMFWRAGPYGPLVPAEVMGNAALRRAVFDGLRSSTDPTRAARDTAACLALLAERPGVAPGPVGVVGYCMGGGMALRAAALFPDRIAAAASFHGGRLATEQPDSPHLLAGLIRARVLVAGADADDSFPPEQADRLRAALDAAGVDNRVTIYPGAGHGFVPPDTPAHDPDAAERHWVELLALFGGALGAPR